MTCRAPSGDSPTIGGMVNNDLRRWMRLVEGAEITVVRQDSYKSKKSALDYDGINFENLAIMQDGKRIGEISAQLGRRSVTIRNVILYDAGATGKGIGKLVYAKLHDLYRGKVVRSSYSTNTVKGQVSAGLSDQAVHMWDSLVANGQAKKLTSGDRFYYVMTAA